MAINAQLQALLDSIEDTNANQAAANERNWELAA